MGEEELEGLEQVPGVRFRHYGVSREWRTSQENENHRLLKGLVRSFSRK